MALIVATASEADAHRFAAIEESAITPNATNSVLFPGPFTHEGDSRAEVLKQYLQSDPACHWVKVIDQELEGKGEEAVVAFSVWYFWDTKKSTTLPQVEWGAGTNAEACELYFGSLERKWLEAVGDQPHAYLKFMHTEPGHQRRGAGSLMLSWGLNQADGKGLLSYLQSSNEGKRLYERFGFQTVDTHVVDLSKWGGPSRDETPIMIRQAGGARASSSPTSRSTDPTSS